MKLIKIKIFILGILFIMYKTNSSIEFRWGDYWVMEVTNNKTRHTILGGFYHPVSWKLS